MAGKNGGKRPGAGRKPKTVKYKSPIEAAEGRCRDRLPRTIDNLEALADGGTERVEEAWEPAGTITRKAPLLDAAKNPTFDARGNPLIVEQPAFPGRPPDEMVLVSRKVVRFGPDRAANEYLADRVLGKPRQSVDLGNKDDEPLRIIVQYADGPPLTAPPAPGPAGDP